MSPGDIVSIWLSLSAICAMAFIDGVDRDWF